MFSIQLDASNHMIGETMGNAKELETFLQGSNINTSEYKQLVDVFGEEKADNMVNLQKPKSQTVGFANQFKDGNLAVKIAHKPETLKSAIKDVDSDGWCYLILNMIPNSNGAGWHVSEDFVETFQQSNERRASSQKDSGFRLLPFMNKKKEEASSSDEVL